MSTGDSADRQIDSRNLILTGFMGTGKTAVGQELARRLGREFVDMDALIKAREGMSVSQIFRQQGEPYFRRLEAELCRELAARPELAPPGSEGSQRRSAAGMVIATGGGTLVRHANREILGASGPIICLTASPDEILRRLEGAKDRPLLDVADRRERVVKLLGVRSLAYGQIPLQVDTSGLTVDQAADQVLALASSTPARAIAVHHPGGEYTIHMGSGLLAQVGPHLRAQNVGDQIALVTNTTVGALYAASVTNSLEGAGFHVANCTVLDGEVHKNLDTVRTLYDCFIDAGLDRRGAVLALGGGVVGDMAGFAAASYLRGVPLVQLPTTLLAMVDSSVGGKVAVDHPRGKNLVGAFKQPEMVIADPTALSTLPARERAGGLAEVVKMGLIGDPALFEQIETHGPAPVAWLIERAVRAKVAVVEQDPYERGRRAVLNLGHTFAHALELLSNYGLSHGEGVSVGLVAAARLSARLGLCQQALAPRVEGVLNRLGLPTAYRSHTPVQIWEAMATDKKRRGKTLRFILLCDVGAPLVTEQVAQEDVLAVLETLG